MQVPAKEARQQFLMDLLAAYYRMQIRKLS